MHKSIELPGEITISRMSGGDGTHPMRIRIIDEISSTILCEFDMSFENFARALTSEAYVEGKLKFYKNNPIGKKRETKNELVPVAFNCEKSEALEAMKAFEVDGWKGRVDDLFNSHCTVGRNNNRFQKVGFVRFVENDNAQKETDAKNAQA